MIREQDNILIETLKFLELNWLNENVGIVACCLVDGNKKVFATSSKHGVFWRHAERNAYQKFKDLYSVQPSHDALFVVTLSPCIKQLKYRHEDSCTTLMNQLGIKRVHFGVLDEMHATSCERYVHAGLIPSTSEDSWCIAMCEKLKDLFNIYDTRINSDLLGIKHELGNEFFAG